MDSGKAGHDPDSGPRSSRQIRRLRKPKATGQLRCSDTPRQLQQGQRVTPRFPDDPVAHELIESARDDDRQQGASIVLFQPCEQQLGQAHQLTLAARFAHPEDDPDRLRQKASGYESQHLARGPVEPLGVVHEAHERPLGGNFGQQTKRPKPNQEGIGCISEREAERHPQRVPLGPRKYWKLADHRRAQLMQPRER